MKKIAYLVPVLLATLLASCTEPIEFNGDAIEPYVVLISRPVSDSAVCVHLSHSRFFLDNTRPGPVTDATVTLTVNGVPTTGSYSSTAYNDYGAYVFNVRPQVGDSLRVEAAVPGYDKLVSAGTRIPQAPEVEVLEFVIDTGDGVTYNEYGYIESDPIYYKVRFKVKSHSDNEFYSVRIRRAVRVGNGTEWWWDTTGFNGVMFQVNDPIVNSSSMEDVLDGYDGSFWGEEMVFGSELFVDGEHEFTAQFNDWESGMTTDFTGLRVYLVVRALSPELYRYEHTASNSGDFFDEIFGEPVQVYCNIDGGIGVFGASTSKRFDLPAPRFEHFPHNNGYYFKSSQKRK